MVTAFAILAMFGTVGPSQIYSFAKQVTDCAVDRFPVESIHSLVRADTSQ